MRRPDREDAIAALGLVVIVALILLMMGGFALFGDDWTGP